MTTTPFAPKKKKKKKPRKGFVLVGFSEKRELYKISFSLTGIPKEINPMYPDRHFDMVAKFAGTGSDTGRIQHLLREKRVRKDYFQLNTSDLDTITNYFLQKLIEKEQKE